MSENNKRMHRVIHSLVSFEMCNYGMNRVDITMQVKLG